MPALMSQSPKSYDPHLSSLSIIPLVTLPKTKKSFPKGRAMLLEVRGLSPGPTGPSGDPFRGRPESICARRFAPYIFVCSALTSLLPKIQSTSISSHTQNSRSSRSKTKMPRSPKGSEALLI